MITTGANIGLSDFSGTCGEMAGPTINFGMGRYLGLQLTLNKDWLSNIGSTNFTDYVDGISVGVGFGLGSPISGTFKTGHSDF